MTLLHLHSNALEFHYYCILGVQTVGTRKWELNTYELIRVKRKADLSFSFYVVQPFVLETRKLYGYHSAKKISS